MNPQATTTPQPQPQAGSPIQPQAINVSPQGAAAPLAVQSPTPPVLPQGQAPVATPAPASTPNFNTSGQLANIAAYYQIPRTTAAVAGAGQAMGKVAESNFEAQKAQNDIKIQNQQDSLDPTKYQFSKNPDGSVTILNSVGDKVDIGTYAALTGDNPAEALQKAGATDKASQQFIAAYDNLQSYIQAKIGAQNGDSQDQATIQQYNAANPGLANMELGQLQSAFMQQYGQYFGQPEGNQNALKEAGVNSTLANENNPAATSAYENPLYATLPGGSNGAATTYAPSPVAGATTGSNANSTSALLASLQAQEQLGG